MFLAAVCGGDGGSGTQQFSILLSGIFSGDK